MNESDFLQKWNQEKPMYEAWGNFVVAKISETLANKKNVNLKSYLKIPAEYRVKNDGSLVDKAFHRKEKEYCSAYDEIEDKVGARFVVLLTSDIDAINNVIKKIEYWNYKVSRHYEEERQKNPNLFSYQSVHLILTSKKNISHNGISINEGISCEIQIRTLLQHAYAELTHDAIYKTKKLVEPKIHRTVSKSMALIEITDEFFCTVSQNLGVHLEHDIYFNLENKLDELYLNIIANPPINQKSSKLIYDTFDNIIDADLNKKLEEFVSSDKYQVAIKNSVIDNSKTSSFFKQSVVFFIYYLIKRHKNQLEKEWPLDWQIIQKMAKDIGIALSRQT